VIESSVKIELQIAKDLERHLHEDLPSLEQFQQWLNIGFAQLEKLMTENNTRQPTILKKKYKARSAYKNSLCKRVSVA
jgi:hypothetical protein